MKKMLFLTIAVTLTASRTLVGQEVGYTFTYKGRQIRSNYFAEKTAER